MNRRQLLKGAAGLATAGTLGLAGCTSEPEDPSDVATTANVEVESGQSGTYVEVSGTVGNSQHEGTLSRVKFRVDLRKGDETIASKVKTLDLAESESVEYTTTFGRANNMNVGRLTARVVVLKTWAYGGDGEESKTRQTTAGDSW